MGTLGTTLNMTTVKLLWLREEESLSSGWYVDQLVNASSRLEEELQQLAA